MSLSQAYSRFSLLFTAKSMEQNKIKFSERALINYGQHLTHLLTALTYQSEQLKK